MNWCVEKFLFEARMSHRRFMSTRHRTPAAAYCHRAERERYMQLAKGYR